MECDHEPAGRSVSLAERHETHQSEKHIAATTRFALSPQDELETALSEASAGNNKPVIIAIINKAYVEGDMTMLSVFLQSFWLGEDTRYLINHLLLVSVDQVSYERCKFLRLHCYRLVTEGVDFGREKLYNSQEFKNMMWRRTEFLADVLRRGYSFIFTDADVMWLRDPLKMLRNQDVNQTDDIQMSCDIFNGDPWSGFNSKQLNTGFYYVRSTNNTIALFNTWYKMKEDPHFNAKKDQDALKTAATTGFAVSPQDELETALSEASAGNNKTVIIAIINKAYVDGEMTMLSVFLQSFWLGEDTRHLINHLLLVSVDQISYERCKFLRLHCYRLVTEGVDFGREKLYNSHEFINMMWRRTEFLADVLRRGYSFISCICRIITSLLDQQR
ncbi:hypothetical protein C5167_012680 [Papaver somniferum]|uniref:Nucleotide-diphospho-sugar transferase domain-containing protein n=1 Tax=Papaver somniferum TaxID=3469 RepID=A0A4Y7J2F7_PAPSO|nr:hypothetical protein C5167_012680 [Papaver somniferum]